MVSGYIPALQTPGHVPAFQNSSAAEISISNCYVIAPRMIRTVPNCQRNFAVTGKNLNLVSLTLGLFFFSYVGHLRRELKISCGGKKKVLQIICAYISIMYELGHDKIPLYLYHRS